MTTTHDSLTEAAWYALAPFVNPIDCSTKVMLTADNGRAYPAAIPMNSDMRLP